MNMVLDLFFPARCVECGSVGGYICVRCRKTIEVRSLHCPECDRRAVDGATHPACKKAWGLDGLTTVFYNRGVLKKAIKQLKYRFVAHEAETLIAFVPAATLQMISSQMSPSFIYPIPLHKDRLKWRGFNQSEKLAQQLSIKMNLPLVSGLLERKQKRIPQADISKREERIKNAQGLFEIAPTIQVSKYTSVILFDDIWTTGATMKEATKVLKRHGVERVWGMTLAR